MNTHGLRLRRSAAALAPYLTEKVIRQRIEVTDWTPGTDPAIFLYHPGQPNPTTGEVVAYFEKMASAYEMAIYPVDGPDPETEFPFFRKSFVELDFASLAEVEEFWVEISARASTLMGILNHLKDDMETVEFLWVGATDANPSESSLSEAS